MLVAVGGFVLVQDGVLRSNDPYVGFEPSPRAYRGEGISKTRYPRSCDRDVGFSQAPEHVEGGYCMRKEEVVLDS
jgi:hypothetical protein